MIDKNATLLRDPRMHAHTSNTNVRQHCRANIITLLEKAEPDCHRTQAAAVAKHEELKIALDIFNQASSNDAPTKYKFYSCKAITEKATAETAKFAFRQSREDLIASHLRKAGCLFHQSRVNQALDAFEEVLKVNPDNEHIHYKLLQIHTGPSREPRRRSEQLKVKYKFKHAGSFGSEYLQCPAAIAASDSHETLYVSDLLRNKLFKFNIDGNHMATISPGLKSPWGLFKDESENIWICDFGNGRLLALDPYDRPVNEVKLEAILGKSSPSIYPGLGCLNKDRFYLILMDSQARKRRIVSFNTHDPRNSLEYIPLTGLQTPQGVAFFQDQLYVGNYIPAGLFAYDTSQKAFYRFSKGNIPDYLIRFTKTDDGFLLCAGEFIVKISLDGEGVFVADLPKILGTRNVNACGLVVIQEETGRTLFVTDNINGSIHKFII
jgi:hypothetical protein